MITAMKNGELIRLTLAAFLGASLCWTCCLPLTAGPRKPERCSCDCACDAHTEFQPRAFTSEDSVCSGLMPVQINAALMQKEQAISKASAAPAEGLTAASGWVKPLSWTALSVRGPEDSTKADDEAGWDPWLNSKLEGAEKFQHEPIDDEFHHHDQDLVLAMLWLALIISATIYFAVRHGRAVTWTHLGECVAVLTWLLSGLFMFCFVIKFESSHFKGEKTLNLVEFVYLMAQIITTVGYGDVTPANPRGRICMGAFVLVGLMIWANTFAQVSSAVLDNFENHQSSMRGRALQNTLKRASTSKYFSPGQTGPTVSSDTQDEDQPSVEESWTKLLNKVHHLASVETQFTHAALAYIIVGAIGACFFHISEKKSLVEAVYMVIITSTSLGFGACTPISRNGFAFAAFWMVLACASLGIFIGSFAQLMVTFERYYKSQVVKGRVDFVQACEALRQKDGESVNLYEFSRLMLLHTEAVQLSDLECIEEIFQELEPDQAERVKIDRVEGACATTDIEEFLRASRRPSGASS